MIGTTHIRAARRGAILLEMLLALGLFVAASLAISATMRQGVASLTRSRDETRASDLARSGLALLEAGLETPQTLDGPVRAWGDDPSVWEGDAAMAELAGELSIGSGDGPPVESGWVYAIETEPSSFNGLTKVTITVRREDQDTGAVGVEQTLVQLVRLGQQDAELIGSDNEINEIGEATRGGQP